MAILRNIFLGTLGGILSLCSVFGKLLATVDSEKAPITFEEPNFSPLEQTSAMRLETICMMKCLEEIHYAQKKLKMIDLQQVLREYIEHIDAFRLLFLQSEIDEFSKIYAAKLDIFLNGGSLTPGFAIFEAYRQRIRDRVKWIFDRIEKNEVNLYDNRTFVVDREKEAFPQTKDAMEQLWIDRINFEIVNEIVLEEASERGKERKIIEFTRQKEKRFLSRLLKRFSKEVALPKVQSSPKKKTPYLLIPICEHPSEFIAQVSSLLELRSVHSTLHGLAAVDKTQKVPLTLDQKIELAKRSVLQRYKGILKSIARMEPWMIQESFVNSVTKTYDPHTVFLSRVSMEDLKADLHHAFVGIGAVIADENGSCVINGLLPGSPAARSEEIQVGDRIVAVAQENEAPIDVTGMLLSRISRMLRGERGTKVYVTLRPSGDAGARKVVELVRDEIALNESRASAKLFTLQRGGKEVKIGVIVMPNFYEDNEKQKGQSNSTADVGNLIEKLKARSVDGIIIDIRDNNGGFLNQAVGVSGLFVEGPIVRSRGRYGNIEQFRTSMLNGELTWDGPLIVLISKTSVSAAEILAGALKDHGRALIVGDQSTFGKGTIQSFFPMELLFSKFRDKDELGAADVTTQKWYRPSGASTQAKGVEADIVLPSFDALLPIGEQDLPHAIEWDTIEGAKMTPREDVTPEKVVQLNQKSLDRQEQLEEFKLLKDRIAALKKVVDTKAYSLNLEQRRKESLEAEATQRDIDVRMKQLIKDDFPYEKILLDGIDAEGGVKKTKKKKDPQQIDTHLRECLRIMMDYLEV